MKKSSLLTIVTALILSSCGITSQYTSTTDGARFQDGIYSSSPSFRSATEKKESRALTDALIEETKASQIYLLGEKKDTVMIPANMSASIRYDRSLASTVVTVGENPYAWQYDLDLWSYYTPYSIGSSWYWSRHYDPWFNNYWYWNRWPYYSSWSYYSGWYDPWYYGGWYDPWYYGGWYGYMDPYHHGWYHHHHHHHAGPGHINGHWNEHGRPNNTDRIFASRVSTRGGIGTSSRVSSTTTSASSRTSATRVTSTQSRTSVSRPAAATARRSSAAATRPTSNHRRPAAATSRSSSGTVSRSTTSRPTSVPSYRSSSGSSTPSYRSSGSSSSGRSSSYSPGSVGRSSGGGGSSRSGSSGAGRSSGGSRR